MSVKYYSGIGSRETPDHICNIFSNIATIMAVRGVMLRSGGARGADKAFENKYNEMCRAIYLPYKGFNKSDSDIFGVCENAIELAKQFHPKWDSLSPTGKLLIARNGYQVLGKDLNTPSSCIVTWTPDGKIAGGTGQALRIANHYKIPIFNFGKNPKHTGIHLHNFIVEYCG